MPLLPNTSLSLFERSWVQSLDGALLFLSVQQPGWALVPYKECLGWSGREQGKLFHQQ